MTAWFPNLRLVPRLFFPTVLAATCCVTAERQPDLQGDGTPGGALDVPFDAAVFASGEVPAIAPPAALAAQVWPMPNPPGMGLPNERAYELVTDGLALDMLTGLMWQRVTEPGFFTWEGALAHCEDATLGGYSDWRVPSRIEMLSILALEFLNPSIDRVAFPNTPSDWFWTSTQSAEFEDEAWYVYFYFGYPNLDRKNNAFSLRCVRSAAELRPRTDDEARFESAGEVTRDRWTGLVWQRYASVDLFTFADANRHCQELQLGEAVTWRAPTMLELQTIVDVERMSPAIDTDVFPNTEGVPFWSSSPWSEAPELRGWYVDFETGAALYLVGTTPQRVRCVVASPNP